MTKENKCKSFYMRCNDEQKELINSLSKRYHMNMSSYVWHLVIKDKERIENEN